MSAHRSTPSQDAPGFTFTRDWFSHNIPTLQGHLAGLAGKPGVKGLEIGSFEGRSACWFLENILSHPSARLTCIDIRFAAPFDANIERSGAPEKVTKIEASSNEALDELQADGFDFVLVDGSHRARNVLHDALMTWQLLQVGGVLIFDDYRWGGIARGSNQHPSHAIDRFLALVAADAEVLHKGYSVVVRKLAATVAIDVQQELEQFPDSGQSEWQRLKQRSWWRRSLTLRGRLDLLRGLVRRDLKLVYKRPALGFLWALIVPLAQLLVFYVLFYRFLAIEVPHFVSFVFIGLMSWSWFQGSVARGTTIIVSNRGLIRQPGFPVELLPLVVLLSRLSELVIALPVLVVFLVFDGVVLGWSVLLLPLVILLQALVTAGFVYPLAALNVRLRDTQHFVAVALHMTFFLSGIFYDIDRLPDAARSLLRLNPMVHLINAYRDILLNNTAPEWSPLIVLALVCCCALAVGFAYFRHRNALFVEDL